jgi:His-Xaa-Ser system protein HxsD
VKGIARAEPSRLDVAWRGDRGALRVDLSIFAIDAVLRASYALTGRCHLFVDRREEGAGHVTVTVRPKTAGSDLEELLGELSNELIDQQIRERLAERAGMIREMIVAQAFADGNLLDPDRDGGDPEDDPRGIGTLRGKGPLGQFADHSKASGR